MKKQKINLALITLGSAAAIATPAIIVGSIYAYNNNKVPIEQTNLIKFYDEEEGSLFSDINFKIIQSNAVDGRYLVSDITINNIAFIETEKLNNFSYNIEILQVFPDPETGTLKFSYKISSINNESIQIIRESIWYRGCFDNLGNFHLFIG